MKDIWEITRAIQASLAGGIIITATFSTWLGKVWGERILAGDRAKIRLNKKIHEYNVAVTRINTHKVKAIQRLYVTFLWRCIRYNGTK